MQRTGECIMPKEGVFARVVNGGVIACGDDLEIVTESMIGDVGRDNSEAIESRMNDAGQDNSKSIENGMNDAGTNNVGMNHSADMIQNPYRAAILTASDRSFRGEREDKSGPKIAEMLTAAGYRVGSLLLLPDDEDGLAEALIRLADEEQPDVIFTTGGTGFSPRDRMPEATKRVIERETPGISEAIRAYSMQITPRAMLSRAVSGIRGKTLIVNLPGSPKAVQECLEFLLPPLEHGLGILRGEADA
ncbi:MAG: hypothetical protein K5897_05140 [Eubacterium sp.]|nr:hypothetical protein [Eubacterium sp.]